MSRFVKALEGISHVSTQPLGFGTAPKAKQAPMMVVAQLNQANADLADSAVSAKADALLFKVSNDVDALSSISSKQVPWGVRLQGTQFEWINKLLEIGCDFVVFDSESPAQVIKEEKLGRILEVETSLSEGSARAVGQLPSVNVVLIADRSEDLTINQLLDYQRVTAYSGKPALAPLPRDMSNLKVLLEVGVRGVVAEVPAEQPEETLAQIREAIDILPTSKPSSREKISASLPWSGLAPEEEIGEEI